MRDRHVHGNERGVALPMAIFALVVIGVLVGASFFIGRQEQIVGRNTVRVQQAFAAAEAGMQTQLVNWDAPRYNQLEAGDSVTFGGVLTGTGWYRGNVKRLNDLLFLTRAEGFSTDSMARQHVGMLLRLRPVELEVTAALKTQGSVRVTGSSVINGNDQIPAGWEGYDECVVGAPLPGIEWPGDEDVEVGGSATVGGAATGDPACASCQPNPDLDEEAMLTLGDATFDEWRQYATKRLTSGNFTGTSIIPVVNAAGGCNTSAPRNWGEPYNSVPACANYFPIIWIEGDANIQGDRGQGVLLVNGNLTVQGNFQFFGPIIVKGSFYARGTGDQKFMGGVIAANVTVEDQTVTGNARINYSSCAVERALSNSAPAFPLRSRSWANLY